MDRRWALWAPTADSPPAANYTTSAVTVTDAATGLIWQRAVTSQTFTWQAANEYCASLGLGGQTGWRLPAHIELLSLIDLGRSGPAIDVSAFPDTPAEEFWSSSLVVGGSTYAWGVGFDSGGTRGDTRTSGNNRVRCVRAGKSAPGAHYTSTTDTVRDNATGLSWQRTISGNTYSGADAKTYCQGLSLAGFSSGWRLPSLKELETLVDVRSYAPAIDAAAFPNTPTSGPSANGFWSASVYSSLPTFAWGVGFDYGYNYSYNLGPNNVYRARCVR